MLKPLEIKRILWKAIDRYFKKYQWDLHHWVILDNHYHLISSSRRGKDLRQIIKGIHGSTAIPIQQATKARTPIWWNYWDYCPRNENDYYIRPNYLLWNPVKHGYVERIEDYRYSSYHDRLEEKGKEGITEQLARYPEYQDIVLGEAEDDDF